MELRGKTCLVTGGAGIIGFHIAKNLLNENANVVILDVKDVKMPGIRHECADITNPHQMKQVFENYDIDIVFHQAGQADILYSQREPASDLAINAMATLNLLRLCRDYEAERFIFASTAAVYGKLQYSPVDEKHPTDPLNPYAVSKLAAEKYVRIFNDPPIFKTTNLRYFNVYSSKAAQNRLVMANFLGCLLQNKSPKLFAGGNQKRDFVHVEDVARANILAAKNDSVAGETFNIGTGIPTTVKHLWQMLKELFDSDLEPEYADAEPEIYSPVADITKAKRLLNYSPVIDLQKGLETLVEDIEKEWHFSK